MDFETGKDSKHLYARPIAITGYSYRLPGRLRTDEDFWRLLSNRDFIRVPIADRYGRGYRPIGKSPGNIRFASPYEGLICDGGELEFDRGLFDISQFEVANMNPQVRMLLSCVWEVIEHAGWDIHKLRNSATGVFVGAQTPAIANWRPPYGTNEYSVLNSSLAMLANQVSYHFNLMGSSMTYCTACSAGLSAMYTAFNALTWGHCDRAIVGSVTYLGSARQSSGFANLGVVSPDGRCYSFDANANGYMRSEGCVVFALKPLEVAENDGDHIFAVIESTAVNSAGAADDSEGLTQGRYITAPTRHSQISLIRSALALANREPEQCDYVEAHATGTVVGDRIEGNAISEAFSGSARTQPLRIASVKSNIGHLEAAAFNASLLKIILMMNRRTFAPISRNYFEPNPEIDFTSCPMEVQTECEPFPDRPVIVGINSFGIGGANGHCVVSEYRPSEPRLYSAALALDSGFLFPLSARTKETLVNSAKNLADLLENPTFDLYTLAANLAKRRTHFAVRSAFSALSHDELLDKLRDFEQHCDPDITVNQPLIEPKIAMVFAGQGTQWAGCGRKLYDTQPVFRRVVDAIEEHWLENADFSLRQACFYADQEDLNEAKLAQPVIFMIECALFELLRTWGVQPAVVVGHSSGEAAAAYASGALSLADATKLIFERGQLQQQTAGSGRMLAVGINEAGIRQILGELQSANPQASEQLQHIEIACLNSPASVVVCGRQTELEAVIDYLDANNIQNRLLPGNIAFHSKAMEAIQEAIHVALAFLDACEFDSKVPFVSSVTGVQEHQLDAAYWWSNIRATVNFQGAIEYIKQHQLADLFIEISPQNALQAMVLQCVEDLDRKPSCLTMMTPDADERNSFHDALGGLYRAGVALNFDAQFPRPRSLAHLLPGHPKDLHISIAETIDDEMFVYEGGFSHGPLIGHRVYCDHLLFEAIISNKTIPYLSDHKVQSSAIMPAAGYMELIFEAFEGEPVYIEHIEFLQPCPIPNTPIRLQTALYPADQSSSEHVFKISSRGYDSLADNELHCQGRVKRIDSQFPADVPRYFEEIDQAGYAPVGDENEATFYDRIEATLGNRFQYGPHFQTLHNLKMNPDTRNFLFDVKMDEFLWESGKEEGYVLAPPLVDGALQIFLVNLMQATDLFTMPRRAKNITYLQPPSSPRIRVHVTQPEDGWYVMDDIGQLTVPRGEKSGGNMRFYDSETGELFLHVQNYIYFTSNPNWAKAPDSKHAFVWQPKFLEPMEAQASSGCQSPIEPVELIRSIALDETGEVSSVVHMLELAGEQQPEHTLLSRCIRPLAADERLQTEYWLVNSAAEITQAAYDALHHHKTALRFATYDEQALRQFEEQAGLLRESAVQVLILHETETQFTWENWALFQRLLVPGGLVLVIRSADSDVADACPWSVIQTDDEFVLLQAPASLIDSELDNRSLASRLVIGLSPSCISNRQDSAVAARWCEQIGERWVVEKFTTLADAIEYLDEMDSDSMPFSAIDCFVETASADPTGENICTDIVELVQALLDRASDQPESEGACRVNVVTQNAVKDVSNPAASSVWGLIRSVVTELASDQIYDFRLIDTDHFDNFTALAWLAQHDVGEREVAIRDGQLWVPRLIHLRDRYPLVDDPRDVSYRLTLENPGQVTGLQFKTCELPKLDDHDIEVAVKYAGLNFRDVMVTLGMLPPQAYERSMLGHEVGMEASAVVRKVGAKVTAHQVGDEVMINQGGCIANHVVVNEYQAFAKPAALDMAQASSVLSVYVTAYYSLIHLAELSRGQRVLIHSAMGGVGQAAIQIAKYVGASIYATAGSEEKRRQLLEMGVQAVFDSHSFEWHKELMDQTGNKGVDVILNSLAGHHVSLCIQSLCPGGWHLEIGKVDIYADSSLSLSAFRKNLRFAAIDIDRLMCDNPVLIRSVSETCLRLLAEKKIQPIACTVYCFSEYVQALRHMISGQHQGKLVLQSPSVEDSIAIEIVDRRDYFDPDATYLMTGGFGGFGIKLLPYFVVNGARHFTYLDRDPNHGRNADWIKEQSCLTYLGKDVEIDIVAGDVAKLEDIQNCIAGLKRPLKGVFHLAGVLDDGLLSEMTSDSIASVFAPKATGALNLHTATYELNLDYFVLFSSIASLYGNIAQSNYSAASAFLDGLVTYRRQMGLAGLSCNMAGVVECGMASRSLHVMRMIRATGMPPVSLAFTVANFNYAMRSDYPYDHVLTAMFERPPWLVHSSEYLRSGRCISNQLSFQQSNEVKQTVESVMAQISEKVAELCGHEDCTVDDPLSSFGLTSISVAELGAFIQTQFDYQVSTLDLMTTSSCRSVATAILSGSRASVKEPDEADVSQNDVAVSAVQPKVQHQPSRFALRPEEHFPDQKVSGMN